MAANFKIGVSRKNNCVHLKLNGNFDGSSAHELINMLKKCCKGIRNVFVHTSSLRSIHPFGRNVFSKSLHQLGDMPVHVVFTGDNADQIVPEVYRNRGNAVFSLASS